MHSYDGVGNRVGMLDIYDGLTTYSYDAADRLVGIHNPYNERTTFLYDLIGREQRRVAANGMVTSHTYDAAGWETVLEHRKADGTALAVYTATYDAGGNRLTTLELNGARVTFSYDALYQLVNEQRSGQYVYDTTYVYDPAGNRVVKEDSGQLTTYLYNEANELLVMTPPTGDPTTYAWDANGNLWTDTKGAAVVTYTWDDENLATRGRLRDCRAGGSPRPDLPFHRQYPTRKRGEVTNRVKPSDNVSCRLRADA